MHFESHRKVQDKPGNKPLVKEGLSDKKTAMGVGSLVEKTPDSELPSLLVALPPPAPTDHPTGRVTGVKDYGTTSITARQVNLPWASTFYTEPGLDPKIHEFIASRHFQTFGLGCQDESWRWARVLKKQFPDATIEVVGGMFCFDGEDGEFQQVGHSWVTADLEIFDPTAAQFDFYPQMDRGEYQEHESEEVE